LRTERAIPRVVDHGSDDVCGEHVGCELQALKMQTDRGCESFERKRLRETGHTFEKDVAIAKQTNDQAINELFLTNDHASHLLAKRLHPLGVGAHSFVDGLDPSVRLTDRRLCPMRVRRGASL